MLSRGLRVFKRHRVGELNIIITFFLTSFAYFFCHVKIKFENTLHFLNAKELVVLMWSRTLHSQTSRCLRAKLHRKRWLNLLFFDLAREQSCIERVTKVTLSNTILVKCKVKISGSYINDFPLTLQNLRWMSGEGRGAVTPPPLLLRLR